MRFYDIFMRYRIIFLLTGATGLIVFVLIVLPPQLRLRDALDTAHEWYQKTGDEKQINSFIGASTFRLSYRIEDFIEDLHGVKTDAADQPSLLWAFYRGYLTKLVYTVLLVAPPAILMCLICYILSCVYEEMNRKGWRWATVWSMEIIDALPYILWVIPFVYLAGWFMTGGQDLTRLVQNGLNGMLDLVGAGYRVRLEFPYAVYIMTYFLGFSLFLLLFFFKQNVRKIKDLRAYGILDGLRIAGIGNVRLYARLFRVQFSGTTFIRQCLYAVVFIMLFDFSFYSVHRVYNPGREMTVFAEAGRHFRDVDWLKNKLKSRVTTSYQMVLEKLDRMDNIRPPLSDKIDELLQSPGLILDINHRKALENLLSEKMHQGSQNGRYWQNQTDLNALKQRLVLRTDEQDYIFFSVISDCYTRTNIAFIFLLFFSLFLLFDLKGLLDE